MKLAATRPALTKLAAGAAICAVPISIAAAESLLCVALAARIASLLRGRERLRLPRVFWFWLAWALVELVSWLRAPLDGGGEIRHLLLVASLFVVLGCLKGTMEDVVIWRGVFITSAAGSAVLILGFIWRVLRYRAELAAGGDPGFYLRSGGLLHHWMIYAVVEAMVFGALLEFRELYPEERRWTTPLLLVHCVAALLSLTRALWVACLAVAGLRLLWRRPRGAWLVPAIPALALVAAFGPVRHRVAESFQPDYYSNSERVQMLRVGWRMIRENPWFGVGAGRVGELYPSFLQSGEPLPAYHGHLHNNAFQLAAGFGLPVLAAALLCLGVLVRGLWRAYREAEDRAQVFLCRAGLLAVAGFVVTGLTDYTYGHSLGLILLSFAVLPPLGAREPAGLKPRAG